MRYLLLTLLTLLAGCAPAPAAPEPITLATTTSTRDSGLLDELIPIFQEQTGIVVKVVAVGTGQALEMGRRGDADVLLTHAPEAELQFVSEGFGTDRELVMTNDFVLLGPEANPAGIELQTPITTALQRIAQKQATFVSRGDNSGTHMKEMNLWQQTGTPPAGDWYLEAGSGMGPTLRLASEKGAYTLSDRATYLAQRANLQLTIAAEGDSQLQNPYAVIQVNPKRHPHVRSKSGRRFAEFLLEENTQALIGNFGRELYGEALFFRERRGRRGRRGAEGAERGEAGDGEG